MANERATRLMHRTPANHHLKSVLLDAYARRHEGQKIYLRQAAAQRWIEWREQILMGGRPHSGNHSQLRGCDQQLRSVSLRRLPLRQPLCIYKSRHQWLRHTNPPRPAQSAVSRDGVTDKRP